MPASFLPLIAKWAATQKVKAPGKNIKLGDGYTLISPIGTFGMDESWDIESPLMHYGTAIQIKNALELLAGSAPFAWSPSGEAPLKEYRCESWRLSAGGKGWYRLTATFERAETASMLSAVVPPVNPGGGVVVTPTGGYSTVSAVLRGTAGLTQIVSSAADDASIAVPDIGFDLILYGANRRSSLFVGSNSYLTFISGSSAYSGLGATNPGMGLCIGAADRSWRSVWVGSDGPTRYRIRWEGFSGSSTSGSANTFWEITLFSNGVIMLVTGAIGSSSGYSALSSGNVSNTTPFVFTADSSWVFEPNGTGFNVRNGSYTN